MIYISVKVGKKKLILIFISRRSVFYFCGETNKYFILHLKNILRYYMHVYKNIKISFNLSISWNILVWFSYWLSGRGGDPFQTIVNAIFNKNFNIYYQKLLRASMSVPLKSTRSAKIFCGTWNMGWCWWVLILRLSFSKQEDGQTVADIFGRNDRW